MRKTSISIGILAALLCSAASYANSYDSGIKMYRRADFKGAERAFLDVLRKGANRNTKGRVYKYIGLCQFMLGRKSEARTSFHSALKYNPETEIFPNEALDSSVLEFFLKIKQDSKQGIGIPAAPPPSLGKKSYPSPRKPSVSKRKPSVSKQAAAKVSKKAPPRRAKTVPKKPVTKRAHTVKAAKTGKQAVKKKSKKDSMFTSKAKKPPRVIFKDNNTNERSTHYNRLFLPTSEDASRGFQYGKSDLWRFLPFGVGQYVNDSYKLGHAFAAAGILTLGSFVFHMYRLQVDRVELDELYEGRTHAFNNLDQFVPDPEHQDTCNHNLENFKLCWNDSVANWEDYVGALRLYSYLSLAAFVAVWAGGVVEAMVNRPTLQGYSLILPQMHYGYDGHNHQFAMLWQYPLP